MIQLSLDLSIEEFSHSHKDVVFTPDWAVDLILENFQIEGSILDPCRGDGAFSNKIDNCEYCEIQEGKDFFTVTKNYDWVVGNPPYSIYSDWLRHSFVIAKNVLYLIPINKAFNSSKMINDTMKYGGIKKILHLGPGSKLGFPIGFAIGAVHYQKDYKGVIEFI